MSRWPPADPGGRYPWLYTMREMLADRERGIPPKVPAGWRPPTWADLLGEPALPATRYRKRHRAKVHARGLCDRCRRPVEGGAWKCGRCAAELAELHRERRARFKAAGKCQHCGKRPPRPGQVNCDPCAERNRANARRVRARRRVEGSAAGGAVRVARGNVRDQ